MLDKTNDYKDFVNNNEDKKEPYIIDGHSHFGKDNFWPNFGDYNEYIRYNNSNVKEVFAMSVPCPILCKNDNTKIILSYHINEGNEIKHYQVEETNGKLIYKPNLLEENPYREANDYIYNLSKLDSQLKFNYVPLIHPYYYSYDDFSEHITRGAKMFKIHGVACGVIPHKINKEFFKMLEYFEVPIIIHTDYSKQENLLFYNNAINWLECLKNYNIKVYLAHSARLSERAIDIINNDNRYVVGIGPDMLLNENNMTEHNAKDYLQCCFSKVNIDKIIFDLDYPWNIRNIEDYSYDFNTIDRIQMLGLSLKEKDKILSENIKKFIKER